jgi:hypothetical protein
MRIETVAIKVEKILRENTWARNDDDILIYEYLKEMFGDNMPGVRDIFLHKKELGIPAFESITRARRKIQEDHEELRATEKVQDIRYNRQKEVISYVCEWE